jgi:hypothetical protein
MEYRVILLDLLGNHEGDLIGWWKLCYFVTSSRLGLYRAIEVQAIIIRLLASEVIP